MGGRLSRALSGLLPLLVAACGGGGGGGPTESGGADPRSTVVTRSAVISTDLDGDGRADCAAVARDGSGAATALRSLGDGRYEPVATDGPLAPALRDLADACDVLDDGALADGFAVHALERPGRAAAAWAVLHLGDGATTPTGPPTVDALDPAAAPAGAVVEVEGHDLAARGVETKVSVGGVGARVLFAFPDRVFFVVPDVALGATDVVVDRGGAASAPSPFEVAETPVPSVVATHPSPAVVGRVLVLEGADLGTPFDRVEVAFSGAAPVRALGLVRAAAVVVPEGATSGPATVAVDGVVSAPFQVTVGAAPAPSVDAVVPGAASVGSLVRVEGRNLLPVGERLEVTVGGARAAVFALRPGAVTVVVPPGALDGEVVVTVGGRASAGVPFDVVARGAPRVDDVAPDTVAPFGRIEVRGTDLVDLSAWVPGAAPPRPLLGDLAVTLGGRALDFVLPTAEGLVVVVPPGATSGDLVVSVGGVPSNPVAVTVR